MIYLVSLLPKKLKLMIGILFIYWFWKAFSNLALLYGKNKWKYFFIGVGSFYGISYSSSIVFFIIIGMIYGFDPVFNGEFDNKGFEILFLFLGGLGCYGVYRFLENKNQKQKELMEKDGIGSIGIVEEN